MVPRHLGFRHTYLAGRNKLLKSMGLVNLDHQQCILSTRHFSVTV